ncbi:MAG: GDSL family lipase [Pirellulales bacterium]|nr:GDSL family lipase [Pirellulales bacterium]
MLHQGTEKRHESFNARAKQGKVDLIFIGDSITQGWEGEGKDVWRKFYDGRKAMNLGIGGDRTQHVLWRLENGNIDGIKPKLAVIMIGTNNVPAGNAPDEIAAGIEAIVKKIRTALPETKILLLGIFPRDAKPDSEMRAKIGKVNAKISKLSDGSNVVYLDIGPKFLNADGTLSKEIMPDLLHLSPQGYQIWADAIEPKVAELLGEHK